MPRCQRRAHTSGDTNTVPAIDINDGHDDLAQVWFVKELSSLLVSIVRNMVADKCYFLRQGKDGSFFGSKEGCLPPGVEGIDPLLGLSGFTGISGMHVDTKG